ncbi:MAG: amino acid adenylation domain-containing protein, partial [Acidobacteriota bacterium]
MVGIYAEVLKLERVGIHDNFFELGGHSLLATQLMSRVNQVFGVEIPLRTLFEPLTIARLAERIVGLQQNQFLAVTPIISVSRAEPLPLSFAQQRLWILDQLIPDDTSYNLSYHVHFKGPLNVYVLEQCLNEIIERHEILRTRFVAQEGQPFQIISPNWILRLAVVDLQNLSINEATKEVRLLSSEEARRPFDLSKGPLIRSVLLKLNEEEYIGLFTLHHIVSDAWSRNIFLRELSAFYTAFTSEESAILDELPIQYADFACWQRKWLQGEVLEVQLSYWKRQLEGVIALELPTDRSRPAIKTSNGKRSFFRLNENLVLELKALSRQNNVTLFMTLLAALDVLLYRYSGQTDISVGTPIANRNCTEIENLIGFFVNTLVMRVELSSKLSFAQLLDRVREAALGAYTHQDVPFEKVVEELQPERDLSRSPLFQVMLAFQNVPSETMEFGDLTLKPLVLDFGLAKFDITFVLEERATELIGSIEYNTDLFNTETITRMITHFERLLEGVVANPDRRINEFSLLSKIEWQQLLIEWNDTATAYSKSKCIHELFEEQVACTPDAIAVFFNNEQLTYQQLNIRANQVAHYLNGLGVGPEAVVGVCLHRSLQMVVALLGILKAGAAYVPLEPDYPDQRLATIIKNAQISVLLTSQQVLERLPQDNLPSICLDKEWPDVACQSSDNPFNNVNYDNIAYILFTSGSTGEPKGVMISHGAIANHMLWMQQRFPLTAMDKVLQKTPFSFDASVWEFYAPLLSGACLIMAQPQKHQDSGYLVNTIKEYGITIIQLVPTLLQMLLATEEFKDCTSLKRVFCGGEALPLDLVEQFSSYSIAALYNLYGPTEATIDTSYWEYQRNGSIHKVSIGRPINNTELYILDQNFHPLPIGLPGELHIGGVGLARGYLNRADLTADKFIPNPYSSEAGTRLYRTGDLARYLPDGNIEYLGRIDQQVKLRGYRIELDEIETVLKQHSLVKDAIVIAREDEPGEKRLVAYLVAETGASVT